uniref:C-X-C chemokine receptor type 5 n=1 Tax=Oryzias latipes TaxID=8090 RepID=A0A3P9MF86_ORYLA
MDIMVTYTFSETAFMGEYDNFTDPSVPFDAICDDEELGLQSFYSIVQPVLYSIIFLLGLAGNGLMTTVLLRRRRRLRITEIYLLHLAVTDLLLLLTFPFEMIGVAVGWVFGDFLCMTKGVLENLNLLCGSFLLACIGFDRYLAIVHAIPSMQSRRPGKVHQVCAVLWFICLLLSTPNAVFLSVAKRRNSSLDCYYYRYDIHAHNWVLANRVLHHISFFFSLVVMSYCYTVLVFTLWKSPKREAKKSAIRLALLVTLVFCVCWLPYNVALLIRTMVDLDVLTYDSCRFLTLLNQTATVTKSLGLSHCCLNPFLYAFVGAQFRSELVHLLGKMGCGRGGARSQGHSIASISERTTTNSTTFIY